MKLTPLERIETGCRANPWVPSVNQGDTEAALIPFKVKVVGAAEAFVLIATTTKEAGAELESLLKAERETPAEGFTVAPIR